MVHTSKKSVVEILLKTWMICEATVNLQDCLHNDSKEVFHQFKACAGRCFDLARDLMESGNMCVEDKVACMVECQTCLRVCRQYGHVAEIAFCGSICETCLSVFGSSIFNHQMN